jgi:hypothetical protein
LDSRDWPRQVEDIPVTGREHSRSTIGFESRIFRILPSRF